MVVDFGQMSSVQLIIFLFATLSIASYEFVLGVVRVQDYFHSYYFRQVWPSTQAIHFAVACVMFAIQISLCKLQFFHDFSLSANLFSSFISFFVDSVVGSKMQNNILVIFLLLVLLCRKFGDSRGEKVKISANMAGKLKEKLESFGLAFLCLASSSSNLMSRVGKLA